MFEKELKSFPEGRAVEKVIEDVEEFIPLSESLFRDVNIDTYRAEGKDVEPVKAPDRGDYRSGISQNPLYVSQSESDVSQTGMHIEKKPSKGKLTVFLSFFIVLILIISVYFIFLSPFSKTHGGGSAISIVPNFSSQLTNGTTVLFTDISDAPSNSVDQWIWDFGDGNISYEQNPVHTYASMGYFNVTLVLISNGKQYDITRTIYVYDIDDIDNDGYPNSVDLFPEKDIAVRFSIINFKVEDKIAGKFDSAKVWFGVYELFNYSVDVESGNVSFNESWPYWIPPENYLDTNVGEMVNCSGNCSIVINVADDKALHIFEILMYSYVGDNLSNISQLDIDGSDSSWDLTLFYNITTGQLYGDDYDGIVDGKEDEEVGTPEDIDCFLKYSIEAV